ncbi:PREDICTED: pleckstrin homology domain-containing family F member 2 isoform X2 [Hipposideros armiger]|uniref:Pleckstrin homology domain-containing family F member 2 isoform X2 n=1 Tax=Hipposideros armiger TaxID=186990 RepID=A0A8B7QG85_HIPAR|nr:PREDICTED: pleckstrin homology domain-containing family F member 2 isoform X2 [Hipposideros armiger]
MEFQSTPRRSQPLAPGSDQVEDTQIGIHNATPNRFVLSFSSPPSSITKMTLTQEQADTAIGQDTLLHKENLFVIPIADSNHITLPFFTQNISRFCGHTRLIKCMKFVFIGHINEFLAASAGKEMVIFILKQLHPPCHKEEPRLFYYSLYYCIWQPQWGAVEGFLQRSDMILCGPVWRGERREGVLWR